jgi:hypothetical protein
MTSPEPLTGPSHPVATAGIGRDHPEGRLRAELLQRHLVARVTDARRQIEDLERTARAPEAVAMTVGATVVEARRRLAIERAASELRVEAFERAARRRGAEIIAEADAEARVLRAAASWLRQARLAGPQSPPALAAAPAPVPVLAAVEARAS